MVNSLNKSVKKKPPASDAADTSPFMYPAAMRGLTLMLVMFAVLVPHLACFLPSEETTQGRANRELTTLLASDLRSFTSSF